MRVCASVCACACACVRKNESERKRVCVSLFRAVAVKTFSPEVSRVA